MGVPSSRFLGDRIPPVSDPAAGQAQDRPSALLETKEWQGEKTRRTVNLDRIVNKSYRANVRRAVGETAADAVHEGIVRMLHHRSGTAYEDLYVYDMNDGSLVGSIVNAQAPKCVEFTEELKATISTAVDGGAKIAVVHNHPDSLPPSASDVRSLISNRARRGIVACHDVSLYVFEIVGDPAPGYTVDDKTIQMLSLLRSGSESDLLKGYEESLGVRVEHLR